MTTNQIDYYAARMKAKNDRLTRKEAKRHNLAYESAQNLSAQAAIQNAAASASQAQTAKKQYELKWESEYGFPYGTSVEEMNDPSNWNHYGSTSENLGQLSFPRNVTPQSYATSQFQIIKDLELARTEPSKRTGNYTTAAEKLAKANFETFHIVKEITE